MGYFFLKRRRFCFEVHVKCWLLFLVTSCVADCRFVGPSDDDLHNKSPGSSSVWRLLLFLGWPCPAQPACRSSSPVSPKPSSLACLNFNSFTISHPYPTFSCPFNYHLPPMPNFHLSLSLPSPTHTQLSLVFIFTISHPCATSCCPYRYHLQPIPNFLLCLS